METAREISIADLTGENIGEGINFDGSKNVMLKLPAKIKADVDGNSASASKLETARQMNISDGENSGESISFDGAENVTISLPRIIKAKLIGNADTASKFENARKISISDSIGENIGSDTSFDGSANITLKLPAKITADLIGNADSATNADSAGECTGNSATASKLETARQINISDGENSGEGIDFDGAEDVTIPLPRIIKAKLIGNADTASKFENARKISVEDSIGENIGSDTSFDGSANITLKLPAKITADLIGNADSATNANFAAQADKLSTAWNFQVNLASTTAGNFDGTSDVSIGVSSVLPVENGGTGKNNLDAVSVGEATKATQDADGNVITEKYSPKPQKISLAIPSAGWATDSSDTKYGFYYEAAIENLAVGDVLNANIAPESHGISIVCGLCPTIEIFDGKIRLKAKEKPAAEISAEYFILKGQATDKSKSYGAINTSTSQREIIYATPEQDGVLTYNGKVQRPVWLYFDWTKLSISGDTTGKDAGSYAVYFTPIGNCTWADDTRTPRRALWKIGKAEIQVPEQSGKLIFNGELQTPELKYYDSEAMTLSGDYENKSEVGTYTAYATPNVNCTFSDGSTKAKSFTWEIEPLKLTPPILSDTEKIYNGSAQSPTISEYNTAYIEQTGTVSEINSGEYSAIYELVDSDNTQWSDASTGAITLPWKIDKAAGSVTLDKNSIYLVNAAMSDTVVVNRLGDGEISASSADSDVATVLVSDTLVMVTAIASGATTISINVAEGANYLATSTTFNVETFIIKPLDQCTPAEILEAAQSGNAPTAWNVGDKTVEIPLNGQIGDALTLADFKICARIIGMNHNKKLESGNKSSVHFALDVTADGKGIAFVDSNYDKASASGVKYFQHNLKFGTNAGGWLESNIRQNILNDFLAALPQEWRDIISPCTKYTDNVGGGGTGNVTATRYKLFLLSEWEVFGDQSYANLAEQNFQAQYEFFANGNSTIRHLHNEPETACYWWLRTPQSTNDTSFARVDVSGVENTYNALYSQEIIPCFMVS